MALPRGPPGRPSIRAVTGAPTRRRSGPGWPEQWDEPAWADCTLAPIGGGRSNLTYRVDCPAGRVVLRRPPVGEVAATAHDMGRERRVISALAGTAVPVPRVLAHADGGPPVDAPCFVMEYLEGVVPLAELPAGWAGTEPERRRASAALVDVLVRLHAVDPAAVGLADFGRPEGFLARQVRRWSTQWDAAQEHADAGGTDPATAAELTRLADALAAEVPTTQRHTIVHGDYRIDNCLFDAADPGRIRAVLDWELSTLGDPLADLGLLLVYWHEADDPPIWRSPSTCPARPGCPGSRAGPRSPGPTASAPAWTWPHCPGTSRSARSSWPSCWPASWPGSAPGWCRSRWPRGWRAASTRWSRWVITCLRKGWTDEAISDRRPARGPTSGAGAAR